jgi:hypothetical protein
MRAGGIARAIARSTPAGRGLAFCAEDVNGNSLCTGLCGFTEHNRWVGRLWMRR